jgi:hypothetical protein
MSDSVQNIPVDVSNNDQINVSLSLAHCFFFLNDTKNDTDEK